MEALGNGLMEVHGGMKTGPVVSLIIFLEFKTNYSLGIWGEVSLIINIKFKITDI